MPILRKLVLPLAMAIALSAAGPAHAARPTVSPADVKRTFVTAGSYQSCAYGYLCAFVPYGAGLYRFDFTRCRRYRVSSWYGTGFALNAQFGGARFSFYDADGRRIFSSTRRGQFYNRNWGPVYAIRPC